MVESFFKALGRFKTDTRGVVLYIVALLMIPLIMLVAIAVDVGQYLVMKNQLASAIDAAALNIGASLDLTDEQATAKAQAFISANFPSASIGTVTSVATTRTATTVDITASATMNTTFLKIGGYDTLATTLHSQVTVKQNKLEVVLVLDNTGSMADVAGASTKIDGLKTASIALTNILFGNADTSKYVKIGVAPFTAAVNVGPAYRNAAWLDSAGVGSLTRENLDVPAGQSLFTLYDQMSNASWRGCVRQRTEPYDVQETAPAAGIPDTLFTPYFAPDEPDSGGFPNSYMPDGNFPGNTTGQTKQKSVAKYNNGTIAAGREGPNVACPVKQILRLTNEKAPVLAEIDGMSPYGNTVIPAGLMWGWHLLSPNGPFGDGVDYSEPSTIKAIVLVTDGQNDINSSSYRGIFNKSVFSAYGYGSGPHLTVDQAATPEGNLNEKLLQLCDNIKQLKMPNGDPRIIVYMIALGNDINSSAKSLLKQCATDPNTTYFTTTTTDQLLSAFQKIALGLNQLRISQ